MTTLTFSNAEQTNHYLATLKCVAVFYEPHFKWYVLSTTTGKVAGEIRHIENDAEQVVLDITRI